MCILDLTCFLLLDASVLLAAVFPGMKPHKSLTSRDLSWLTSTDPNCIIDNPDDTMANDLLGFDTPAVCKSMLANCELNSNDRNKFTFYVVRGVGGCKTRTLEVIRRLLYMDQSVLPIAITCNCKTEFSNIEFFPHGIPNYSRWAVEMSACLSVVSRMIAAFTGHELSYISLKLNKHIGLLVDTGITAEQVVSAALSLMRKSMHIAGYPVKKIVIFFDEAKRIEEVFELKYNDTDINVLAPIRKGVRSVNGCVLAISGLSPSVTGLTDSGCAICPIPIPFRLDPVAVAVVEKWWKIDQLSVFDRNNNQYRSRFIRLASLLCTLPRTLEFVNTYLQNDIKNNRIRTSANHMQDIL